LSLFFLKKKHFSFSNVDSFFIFSTLEELCQEELKKFEKLFSGKHIDSICSTSSQLFSTSKQLNILETKEK